MGSCISSESEGIAFHPNTRGYNISLSDCKCRAQRNNSFHDGLLFSDRPLKPHERVWVKILQHEERWHGALRVGVTSVDPSIMDPALLPPYACPDLTILNDFWAIGLSQHLFNAGTVLCFWVDTKGRVFCQKDGDQLPSILFAGVPKKTPLWAMLDVYGQTKAVQLLGCSRKLKPSPTCSCCPDQVPCTVNTGKSLPSPKSPSTTQDHLIDEHLSSMTQDFSLSLEEDDLICVICQDRSSDTMLLPCCHRSFCFFCSKKVQKQNARCPLCRQDILLLQKICFSKPSPTPG
ncbi:E3 ubiquitin-protein ligase NEURL3 [Discoglossus pictus]